MKDRLLTRPFVLAGVSHIQHGLAFNLFLHLPGFLQRIGVGEVRIGILWGSMALTAIAVRPAMGRLMDVRGRRLIIRWGGALNAAVSALYLTVHAYGPWLYAVRLTHGIAEAMLFASLFAYAADIVPASRRIEGIALFGVSGMLPISVGGLLGDAILARAGYREVFLAATIFATIAFVVSLPLRDHPVTETSAPARGLVASVLQADLLPLWWIGGIFATAIASYFTFLKTYVLLTGRGSIGLFFTLYSVTAVLLRLFFGTLPATLGPKRVLAVALGALVVGLAVLSWGTTPAAIAVAGVFCGFGHGFAFPILLGIVVGRARPSERGAALAFFTALFDGGNLVGGPLFGLIIRGAGYSAMFASAAVLVVLGAAGFAAWERRLPAVAG